MKLSTLYLAAVGASLIAAPALAHHSFAMFDSGKVMKLEGTVRDFTWTNPHSWIRVSVSDETGKQRDWMIELNSSTQIAARGWHPMTVKRGDKIAIAVHPAKHQPRMGRFLAVKLPDGQTLAEDPNFKL